MLHNKDMLYLAFEWVAIEYIWIGIIHAIKWLEMKTIGEYKKMLIK